MPVSINFGIETGMINLASYYSHYATVTTPALVQFISNSRSSLEFNLLVHREAVHTYKYLTICNYSALVQFISRIMLSQDSSLEFDFLVHREVVHNYKYLDIHL